MATRTRTRPARTIKRDSRRSVARRPEVLTLAETADYLRVSEEAALKSVRSEGLPGRLVDGEWRFLRTAVEDWLRGAVQRGSKEAIRTLAGAWKDDPDLDEIVKDAYRQRGRPMTENGE